MRQKRFRVINARRPKKRTRRGGALTDYIPSLSTLHNAATSYVPGYSTASSYYNSGKQLYNDARDIASTAKDAYDIYKELKHPEPKLSSAPPPLPPMDPNYNYDRPYDIAHNKKIDRERRKANPFLIPPPKAATVEHQTLRQPKLHSYLKGTPLETIVEYGRKYRPISFIDNGLNAIGQRDRVRGYLNKSKLGKAIVNTADSAIQFGFGHPRRRNRIKKIRIVPVRNHRRVRF